MAEEIFIQAYLYLIMCLYYYFSSRVSRHLNLALGAPPNQAQCHGLHPMYVGKRKAVPKVEGKEAKNRAHLKSCCHQCCELA